MADECPGCRIVFSSSSEVYGASFKAGVPLDELAALQPANPYASSKAAADLMLGQMALQGLKVARLRPFNHTGPGQTEHFAIPSFAAQIARIERGLQEPVMRVGSLDSMRDFLDVRTWSMPMFARYPAGGRSAGGMRDESGFRQSPPHRRHARHLAGDVRQRGSR